MEQESYLTPRKMFQRAYLHDQHQTKHSMSPSINSKIFTPQSIQYRHGKINLLPVAKTPPSRFLHTKVVNPFEAYLTERLHLPAISSPSLFHRPSTPQESHAQFEWTIDEVSYLGPANVEAHETQFMETPDPDIEAKAQEAISIYFKENNIVPSPMDCQLRNQKITLKKDSSTSQNMKRRRDGSCQTVLTFPPVLPKEIEDLLKPFFSFNENQQQIHDDDGNDCDIIDYEARDVSLRRKLFETSMGTTSSSDEISSLNHLDLEALSPAPQTPELDTESVQIKKKSRHFGSPGAILFDNSPNISISPIAKAKESFGSLSPISRTLSPSPVKLFEYDAGAIYGSTPEKTKPTSLIIDSSHMSVEIIDTQRDAGMSMDNDDKRADVTVEWAEYDDVSYDESATSFQSSSGTQQHPTTPLRHKAKVMCNRKNLSQSFLLYSDEEKFEEEQKELHQQAEIIIKENKSKNNLPRTDSGFSEVQEQSLDVSMQSNNQYDFKFGSYSSNPSSTRL